MPNPTEKPTNSTPSGPVSGSAANSTRPETASQSPVLPQIDRVGVLLSTEPQLAAFRAIEGVDWGDRFVRVMEFKRGEGLFGLRGVKLVEYLWNYLADCRFKRSMELFGSKEDYAVPRFSASTPCVQYPPRGELRAISLRAALFNPARIPLKLIVDLGIVPEPTHKLTKQEELAIKAAPHVIPSLKAILEAAVCVTPGNERILVLRQIDTSKYPDAVPLTEDRLGSLLYFRENTSINRTGPKRDRSEWHAPQQIVSFYPSIYNALRKTDREESSYRVEGQKLPKILIECAELEARAKEGWKPDSTEKSKEILRGDIGKAAARNSEELKGSVNHLKQEARDTLEELHENIQAGSNNITTHRSKLKAVESRLDATTRSAARKSGYNNTDAKNLQDRIARAESAFDMIGRSLPKANELLDREISKARGYFARTDLAHPVRKVWTNTFLASARIPIHGIDTVRERPLRVFAARMSAAFGEFETSLLNQEPVRAKEAIVKMVAIAKLQKALSIFEQLKRFTAQSQPVPLDQLTDIAGRLQQELQKRAVAPETVLPEYKPTYERIQALSQQISSELDTYLRRGRDLSVRTAMYTRLREVLDEVDLELDVKHLPS